MRIVGARFPDRRAFAAREELRRRHRLAERDIAVRRLGTTDYAVLPTELVLAGRFEAEHVADAVRVIAEHGGEVVVNLDASTIYVPLRPRQEPQAPKRRISRSPC